MLLMYICNVIILNRHNVSYSAGLESSPPSVCMCLSDGRVVFLQVHFIWALHHASRSGGIDPGGGGGVCLVTAGRIASGAVSGGLSSWSVPVSKIALGSDDCGGRRVHLPSVWCRTAVGC